MTSIHWRSRVLGLLLALCITLSLPAQDRAGDPSERLRKLEERLEQLARESAALRNEIDVLKRDLGTPGQPDDLTRIDVPPPPAGQVTETVATSPPAQPADLPTEVVQNNPSQAAASKIFNPDISVIGNFVGKAGDPNSFEERPSMSMEETEISFQAFVDPYAQAKFFLAITPEGAELEEGYLNFIALPRDFTARVGKQKATFGKVNLMHGHNRPWIDQPLVIRNFFGDEGLNDSGVSVSRLFANPHVFLEATGGVFSGHVDDVFGAPNANDLFYLGHLKAYRDLTERSNLEIGASVARGTLPEIGGHNQFAGVDLTWRYKPLERAIYRSFIGRAELIANDRSDTSDRAFGFYTSADYQFARRWYTGVRFDRADHADDPSATDRGASLTLTFWPSEFSQIRGQARRVRYGDGPSVNELLLQVQFSIGAHGGHTF